ncbi:MAG: hypothetical protein R2882_14385 [Gemmatimonadales bacterium]
MIVALADGAAVGGGTACDLVRWLERRGGRAPLATAERALKRSLWAAADRLVRVGAATLEVEPVAATPSRANVRALELAGEPLGLLDRDQALPGAGASGTCTRRSSKRPACSP